MLQAGNCVDYHRTSELTFLKLLDFAILNERMTKSPVLLFLFMVEEETETMGKRYERERTLIDRRLGHVDSRG